MATRDPKWIIPEGTLSDLSGPIQGVFTSLMNTELIYTYSQSIKERNSN